MPIWYLMLFMRKTSAAILMVLALTFISGCNEVENLTTRSNSAESTKVIIKENVTKEETTPSKEVKDDITKHIKLPLYFTDESKTSLIKEDREIEVVDGSIIRAVVEALLKGPQNSQLKRTIPEGTALLSVNRVGNTAIIDFSKQYYQIPINDELIGRVSIVNTLANLDGIEMVKIMVEGRELMSQDGQPVGQIEKAEIDKSGKIVTAKDIERSIIIYFGSENADMVVPEKRNVKVKRDTPIEKTIMEEIIKGPVNKDIYPVVPEKTKLLSVETTTDGTCKVNLSKEFVENAFGGSASEAITINSIVNSLTELKNVKRVQFLIEGKIKEAYTHLEFDKPFTRNESMIKNG